MPSSSSAASLPGLRAERARLRRDVEYGGSAAPAAVRKPARKKKSGANKSAVIDGDLLAQAFAYTEQVARVREFADGITTSTPLETDFGSGAGIGDQRMMGGVGLPVGSGAMAAAGRRSNPRDTRGIAAKPRGGGANRPDGGKRKPRSKAGGKGGKTKRALPASMKEFDAAANSPTLRQQEFDALCENFSSGATLKQLQAELERSKRSMQTSKHELSAAARDWFQQQP